ncbi:MAG: hypothetical protein GXP05_12230 [Alphaproteobacteria bacterium]|nr:hypothetical protein [Alphaproteobacteria bacterium]
MSFANLASYIATAPLKSGTTPIAILLIEDLVEVNSTIRHHAKLGFERVIVLGPEEMKISPELASQIDRITYDTHQQGALETAVNTIIEAAPARWIYYGYNAEYLFYPFCESRNIVELTRFVTEERRKSILTYVVDLYADDLSASPNGVSVSRAHLDKSGYYAHSRSRDNQTMERQLDMFGGLRWRFEEHIAKDRRKIDRIGLFYAEKGLKLRQDHTFNVEEYNTYSSPWHHSVTATICSFRVAKSLKTNPGPSEQIDSFAWMNSQKFNWHSRQLLDLGLMESGQWF